MSENKSSYLQILKSTSLFGGVQFFNIIISIIRTKFIAIFIGPEGIGIAALFNSTIGVISGFSGLGIDTSGVKYISGNYKNENLESVSVIVSIVRKLALFTGILGVLLFLLFSKVLSIFAFGDETHTFSFIYLSIVLLFNQITSSNTVVLQGLRKLKFLAKANLYGNLVGLIISIPFYFYLKIDAIIPTIIISSFTALVFSFFYYKKIGVKLVYLSKNKFSEEAKSIVKLGVMLTFSGLMVLVSGYLIQIFIGKVGGIEEVGYYNAGFTLLNSYVGIIFTVMSTDYFPRLASICDDNVEVRKSVIQQSFMSILIITPIIVLFLIFIPLIIKILYTSKFIIIAAMMSFGILGMLFRAVSWSMGYIIIAKGDSKVFVKTAVGFNILSLILNILGYYYYGLKGLGISFILYYFLHFFVLIIITKRRYNFYFEQDFYRIYLQCFLICLTTFFLNSMQNSVLKYILMGIMIIISISFVLYQLNKKMNIKETFNSLLKREK